MDSSGLYFRIKPNGQKSWLGTGDCPEISAALARQNAAKLRDGTAKDGSVLATKRAIRAAEIEEANNTFVHLARELREQDKCLRQLLA